MINILCYGDSNTWGYIPLSSHLRYDESIRFPMVLQKLLGNGYKVYEEGQPARCAYNDDYEYRDGNFNGKDHFIDCAKSYLPLDYIVLFIGSNDMKDQFTSTSLDTAKAIETYYINPMAKISPNTRFIIISPKTIQDSAFVGFNGAYNKSKDFDKDYKELAKRTNSLFISNKILEVGKDGLHLTKKAHLDLASELSKLILN